MSDLQVEDLRMLVAVAEAGSLTAAAARLGVGLNGVSRRLARLEASAGVRLVERTTRRLALTGAGDRLYRRALAVLEQVELARAELGAEQAEPIGTVRVVLPSSAVNGALLARLHGLLARHPRLRVQLLVTSRDLPLAGDVDVAVVVGALPDRAGLVARRVATVQWRLCAAPEYVAARGLPAAPAELSAHDCLRYRADGPQEQWTLVHDDGREEVVPVRGSFESDDSRILGEAAYAGLGVGLRPDGELSRAVAAGALVEVLPGWRFAAHPIHVVSPRGRGRLPGVRTVVDAVVVTLQELV